ncbi:membrane protein [Synergistales bacterium]|nr:membrane protein [Synergistales bacterium]
MEATFIRPDDTLMLWTFMVVWAAVSIWLEQKYKWAATLTGCMIALLGAMFLANIGVVPLDTPSYDDVWGYVVPLAVPLLLFDANIRRIWKESGRTIIIFHVAAIGTILGTFIAVALFHGKIPELHGISAMLTGTYIGGSINLAAMKDAYSVSSQMTSATIVADNFLMALYFFALMIIPTLNFFRKRYTLPYDAKLSTDGSENRAAKFWGAKEISLIDIASSVALSLAIVTASTKLSAFINASDALPNGFKAFFGQKYLLITTITVIGASVFPNIFGKIRGAKEIGTFFIHIFFVVIGVPASLSMIIQNSPLLFAFAGVIICTNLILSLVIGKIFKFNLEEIMVACNATVGGPTTAAAMVIAKGWEDLVVPALLVGVWGYVVGNYAAIALANYLASVFNLM